MPAFQTFARQARACTATCRSLICHIPKLSLRSTTSKGILHLSSCLPRSARLLHLINTGDQDSFLPSTMTTATTCGPCFSLTGWLACFVVVFDFVHEPVPTYANSRKLDPKRYFCLFQSSRPAMTTFAIVHLQLQQSCLSLQVTIIPVN